MEKIIDDLAKLCMKHKVTVATAESCTGGNIARSITQRAGSSWYFKGGIVSYCDEAKIHVLGVHPDTIEEHTAESRLTAMSMAGNAIEKFNTDYGVSTTGFAGPEPSKDGLFVWISVQGPNRCNKLKIVFETTDRLLNIETATIAAIEELIKMIDYDNEANV